MKTVAGLELYYPGDNISKRTRVGKIKSIFLAGTIDNGDSLDWQQQFIEAIAKPYTASSRGISLGTGIKWYRDVIIFNPRRRDWDASWEQTIENPQFYQQVAWELNALDKADIIVMNLLEGSKSPISLLELGLYAATGKMVVICPKKFYRKGNVDFICEKYDIPQVKDIDEAIQLIDAKL